MKNKSYKRFTAQSVVCTVDRHFVQQLH